MRSTRIAVYRRALDTFGVENQISMLHEEIGELLSALGKFRRGRSSEAEIVSELADVRIMLEQVEEVLDLLPGDVEAMIDQKIRRLRGRLPPAPAPEDQPWKDRVALDFDGVVHASTSPFQGSTVIPDGPVPGAFDFIRRVHDVSDVEIMIHTARLAWDPSEHFHEESTIDDRVSALVAWFVEHGLEDEHVERLRFHTGPGKPHATLYVDDRAFEFRGSFPDLDWIEDFRPWNKVERFAPPTLEPVR